MPGVGAEDGIGFALDIWMPETPGLDDGPDVFTLRLQLRLQDSG